MVPLLDDSWVAGPRRVVPAHFVHGPRAPQCRLGPSVHGSEAWPVQHYSPARFPSRTGERPDAQIRIWLPAGSHAWTVSATRQQQASLPCPLRTAARVGGVVLAANRSRSGSFDSCALASPPTCSPCRDAFGLLLLSCTLGKCWCT